MSDWEAIGDWFNADPSQAIVCDARIISSYWSGRWQDEGTRLSENYYENIQQAGGGLMLGTDHNAYHSGINSVNAAIGVEAFSGSFNLPLIPVDTGNPLMTTPNDMGSQLYDDSSPGQTPYGLQPNGRILYSAAWHGANFNTPGISSTFEGTIGFQVEIATPFDGAVLQEFTPITFTAGQSGGSDPITYTWTSDRDGELGAGASIQVATLSVGVHEISVTAEDAAGGADEDTITITVSLLTPQMTLDLRAESDSGVSSTDNRTNVAAPTFDVTVNKPGVIELDFDGDGLVDVQQPVDAAGVYPFMAGRPGRRAACGGRSVHAGYGQSDPTDPGRDHRYRRAATVAGQRRRAGPAVGTDHHLQRADRLQPLARVGFGSGHVRSRRARRPHRRHQWRRRRLYACLCGPDQAGPIRDRRQRSNLGPGRQPNQHMAGRHIHLAGRRDPAGRG